MLYSFNFKIRNGYEFAFNALLKGIYPFRFYGYTIYEIYKYVIKRVDALEEIVPPPVKSASTVIPVANLYNILNKAVYEKAKDYSKKIKVGVERDTVSLDISNKYMSHRELYNDTLEPLLRKIKNIEFKPQESIEVSVKITDENVTEVTDRVVKQILYTLVKESADRKLIAMSLLFSDIATRDISATDALNILDKFQIKNMSKNTVRESFERAVKFTEDMLYQIDPIKNRYVYRPNRQDIRIRKYRRVSPISEISLLGNRGTELISPIHYYKSKDVVSDVKLGIAYNHTDYVSLGYLSCLVGEYRRFLEKQDVKEALIEYPMSLVSEATPEGSKLKTGRVEYAKIEAYMKDLVSVLLDKHSAEKPRPRQEEVVDNKDISSIKNQYVDTTSQEVNKENFKDVSYIPSEVIKGELKETQVFAQIRKNKMKSTYTINRVRKTPRKTARVYKNVYGKKYKDLRFYKRWRYRTGTAHDKIWINPQKEYFLKFEEKENTVEAIISFKAMLDFILFVEQILYVNKDHFKACIPEHAIDRFVDILIEWVTEARPQNEVSDEYEYLVRWCKWLSAGQKNKHINDMALSGYLVLESIRDDMVKYFESRWGGRVVDYGVNGMYIYSKDRSYIDRIRGKKHGSNKRTWGGDMKKEYGISENELIWNVEEERKDNNGRFT